MIVYLVTNKLTGEKYVGCTVKSLKYRIIQHTCFSKIKSRFYQKITEAINKYGIESFLFEEIDSASSKEELLEKERYYISIIRPEYNITGGGSGAYKRKCSDETKNKIREKAIGRTPWNKGIPSGRKGLGGGKRSLHTRMMMIISKQGKEFIPWNKGKKHSEETRDKISKKLRSGYLSGKTKPTRLKPMLGRKHSEETKEKMREIYKNRKRGAGNRFVKNDDN